VTKCEVKRWYVLQKCAVSKILQKFWEFIALFLIIVITVVVESHLQNKEHLITSIQALAFVM